MLNSTYHSILINADYGIMNVENYHALLCQAYNIIQTEINGFISSYAMLQKMIKTIYDTACPNECMTSLQDFLIYFYIIMNSSYSTFS